MVRDATKAGSEDYLYAFLRNLSEHLSVMTERANYAIKQERSTYKLDKNPKNSGERDIHANLKCREEFLEHTPYVIPKQRAGSSIFACMNKKITALCMLLLILSFAASAANKKFVLVIDPGHGGKDAGALGAFSKEKDINLSVAMAFGRQVQRNCHDVKVIYTRTTDVFIGLKERAEIANKNKADLFISVHTNALPGGKQAYGMETYTLGMHRAGDNLDVAKRENAVILIEKDYKQSYQGFNPNSSESYIMFEFMQDRNMANSVDLAKMVQRETCASASRPDKGVHQAGFLVLRETSMPGCLIELGFVTTPDEERLLNDKAKVENIATGIYRAFVNYKNKYHNNIVVPYKPSAVPGTVTPPVVPDDYKTDEPVSPAKTTTTTPRRNENPVTETPRNEQTTTTVVSPRTQTASQNTEAQTAVRPVEQRQPEGSSLPNVTSGDDNEKIITFGETAIVPIFKVQIMATPERLKRNSPRFKGLKNVGHFYENDLIKYTYGASADYNEINRLRKEISDKFPDAFVIAFKDGERMNVNKAIREFSVNRHKDNK